MIFLKMAASSVSITYLHEKTPLGTAGALSLLDKDILSHPVVVTNGDILTDVSYRSSYSDP